MIVQARFDILGAEGKIRGRAYVDPRFFEEAYGEEGIKGAIEHIQEVKNSKRFSQILSRYTKGWVHAFAYQDEHKIKEIHFYGYIPQYGEGWPGDPVENHYVSRNGLLVPRSNVGETGFMSGTIILGEELKHTRESKDLEEYLKIPPLIHSVKFLDGDFCTPEGKEKRKFIFESD